MEGRPRPARAAVVSGLTCRYKKADAQLTLAAGSGEKWGDEITPLQLDNYRLSAFECVVAVIGEVDFTNRIELEVEIENAFAAGMARVFVDLQRCEFIDAAGLAALASPSPGAPDRRVVLIAVPAHVRRVVEITGLGRLLAADPRLTDPLGGRFTLEASAAVA